MGERAWSKCPLGSARGRLPRLFGARLGSSGWLGAPRGEAGPLDAQPLHLGCPRQPPPKLLIPPPLTLQVNEHDEWSWLQPGEEDDGSGEEELWGEEACGEGRSSAELDRITKPTARKPRPPPRRPRPAFSRPASALSGEVGGEAGGSGRATPLQQPAVERAVRLGLRGCQGRLHRDAGARGAGFGMARGLPRLEIASALLEKTREAFLAHALTLTKGGAEAGAEEVEEEGRPEEGGVKARPKPRPFGSPAAASRGAGRGGAGGGSSSTASSPRPASSPRAAPLRRGGDDSPLKASPRSHMKQASENGVHIEVGSAVFCHQAR